MGDTFVKELRDAAMKCSDVDYRAHLKGIADSIAVDLDRLAKDPTNENMRTLNATWSMGARLLKYLPQEAEPNPPLAGAPEPARLAA